MSFQVAPSLLAANFLRLEQDIESVNRSGDILHLDIMDGAFVPNISFGFSVIDQLSEITEVPMDAHLMVVHPERWFELLARDGVQMCSFHYEASRFQVFQNIEMIHNLGMKAGVAIDPNIPVKRLFKYIGYADFFLVMSVFAGFGGQKFIYNTLDRVAELKAECVRRGFSRTQIEIDGGITLENIKSVKDAGADIVVAGSAVFRSPDPVEAVMSLKRA